MASSKNPFTLIDDELELAEELRANSIGRPALKSADFPPSPVLAPAAEVATVAEPPPETPPPADDAPELSEASRLVRARLAPRLDPDLETPAYSSKSDRVREALYAAGTRQRLGREFFEAPARESAAEAQRALVRAQILEKRQGVQDKSDALSRLHDRSSAESVQRRAFLESTERGRALKNEMGEERWNSMSAADLPAPKDFLNYDARGAETAARDRRHADELQGRLDQIQARIAGAKTLEELKAGLNLTRDEATRAWSSTEKVKDRAAAGQRAKDKQGNDEAKAYLEGFTLRPDARPTQKEAQDVRNAQAQMRSVEEGVRDLRAIYARHGTETLPTEARARMSAIARDLQLTLKSEGLYHLGVLSGPDLRLLEELVPNPTTARASALNFFESDQTLPKLEVLVSRMNSRFANKARSLGYVPSSSRPPPSTPSSTVRMRDPEGALHEVDADEADEAEGHGWQRE